MMQHTTVQALGQARLADLHRQARRGRTRRPGHRAPAILNAGTRRPGPAPESP